MANREPSDLGLHCLLSLVCLNAELNPSVVTSDCHIIFVSTKFCENISNGIRVMAQTQNYEALMDGQTDVLTRQYL